MSSSTKAIQPTLNIFCTQEYIAICEYGVLPKFSPERILVIYCLTQGRHRKKVRTKSTQEKTRSRFSIRQECVSRSCNFAGENKISIEISINICKDFLAKLSFQEHFVAIFAMRPKIYSGIIFRQSPFVNRMFCPPTLEFLSLSHVVSALPHEDLIFPG